MCIEYQIWSLLTKFAINWLWWSENYYQVTCTRFILYSSNVYFFFLSFLFFLAERDWLVKSSLVESQNGIITIHWCSFENQKGAIAVVYGVSAFLVLNGTSLNSINALLVLSWQVIPLGQSSKYFSPYNYYHQQKNLLVFGILYTRAGSKLDSDEQIATFHLSHLQLGTSAKYYVCISCVCVRVFMFVHLIVWIGDICKAIQLKILPNSDCKQGTSHALDIPSYILQGCEGICEKKSEMPEKICFSMH